MAEPVPLPKKRHGSSFAVNPVKKRNTNGTTKMTNKTTPAPAQDRVPRERRSETWEQRKEVMSKVATIENVLSPFPIRSCSDWQPILDEVERYAQEHHLCFRARDSQLTTTHNKSTKKKEYARIPDRFKWTFKTFRCTHGVYQKSRSTGERERRIRYLGCPARLTAQVRKVKTHNKSEEEWRVVVMNETRTHNHVCNKEAVSSYLGAASADSNPEMLRTVRDLVDARANPKNITAFMSDKLGRTVSPQQARNIIQRMHGAETPDDNLKAMLHAFVQAPENDALVLQDQFDITCAISTQTSIQKRCFDEWGECVVMDWTHGTNNIGFHLGSLVVTSCTGRGIPVFDFIAVDEKAATMTEILTFFKSKNKNWMNIKTFIIDKDFVEWHVLNQCFPMAKVLLCQYHAITFWRKLVQMKKYNLKIAQREHIETSFIHMLKSSTKTSYDVLYDQFSRYCRVECADILDYYDKNWGSCVDMWSNHARGTYFSAGNTTTNRIEANWNQLKLLLGFRPRIDRAIAGLLAHHVAVIRQFAVVIRRHSTNTRQAHVVPSFLRRASGRLGDYAFRLVRKEWDILHSSLETFSYVQMANSSEWEVTAARCTYICDDLEWCCTCHFHQSVKLPCRHLMLIARDHFKFKQLPEASIPRRWCMRAGSELYDAIENGINGVMPALEMSKIHRVIAAPLSSKAPLTPTAPLSTDDTSSVGSASAQEAHTGPVRPRTKTDDKVVYVRLRRREKADLVVMTSNEKYRHAMALVSPLLERLSQAPTHTFFEQLARWEAILAKELEVETGPDALSPRTELNGGLGPAVDNGKTYMANSEYVPVDDHADDRSNSDDDLTHDAIDVKDMFDTMTEIEPDSSARYLTYPSSSQVIFDDIELSESSQRIINADRDDDKLTDVHEPVEVNQTDPSQIASSGAGLGGHGGEVAPERSVNVLKMPKAGPRNTTRQKIRQTKVNQGDRLAVVQWPNFCVTVHDLNSWAQSAVNIAVVRVAYNGYPVAMTDPFLEARNPTCRMERVTPDDSLYRFVIPYSLVRAMTRAIQSEEKSMARANRAKRREAVRGGEDTAVEGPDEEELVVTYTAVHRSFTRQAVYQLIQFYDIKKRCNAWQQDLRWLRRGWRAHCEVLPMVEMFSIEVSMAILPDVQTGSREQGCADQVIAVYERARLKSHFELSSGFASTSFAEVVGYVARDCLLNDSVINLCIQAICDSKEGCYQFSSLVADFSTLSIPVARCQNPVDGNLYEIADITSFNVLILPINISNIHWVIMTVKLDYDAGIICARFYDPLANRPSTLETKWRNQMLPYIRRWHDKFNEQRCSASLSKLKFPEIQTAWVDRPVQPDGSCCGVMIVAQAYAVINDLATFNTMGNVPATYVEVMRLRILWMILCYTNERKPPPSIDHKNTHSELAKCFNKENEVEWQLDD